MRGSHTLRIPEFTGREGVHSAELWSPTGVGGRGRQLTAYLYRLPGTSASCASNSMNFCLCELEHSLKGAGEGPWCGSAWKGVWCAAWWLDARNQHCGENRFLQAVFWPLCSRHGTTYNMYTHILAHTFTHSKLKCQKKSLRPWETMLFQQVETGLHNSTSLGRWRHRRIKSSVPTSATLWPWGQPGLLETLSRKQTDRHTN